MTTTLMIAPANAPQLVQLGALGNVVPGADATVLVDSSKVPDLLKAGFRFATQSSDMVTFLAPAAPDLVSIVAAVLPVSGTPFTLAAQPGTACKLQVRCIQSGAVAGLVVTIVGVNAQGLTVTENVNVAGASTATFTTANAYQSVTSATPVGTVTNVTTIGIGVSGALGLPLPPGFVDLVVTKEAKCATGPGAPANETGFTVDTVAGTCTPTSAPNATLSFQISYTWTSAT